MERITSGSFFPGRRTQSETRSHTGRREERSEGVETKFSNAGGTQRQAKRSEEISEIRSAVIRVFWILDWVTSEWVCSERSVWQMGSCDESWKWSGKSERTVAQRSNPRVRVDQRENWERREDACEHWQRNAQSSSALLLDVEVICQSQNRVH